MVFPLFPTVESTTVGGVLHNGLTTHSGLRPKLRPCRVRDGLSQCGNVHRRWRRTPQWVNDTFWSPTKSWD